MAKNSTISIGIKMVENGDGTQTILANVKDLKQLLGSTAVEAGKINKRFININFVSITTSIL